MTARYAFCAATLALLFFAASGVQNQKPVVHKHAIGQTGTPLSDASGAVGEAPAVAKNVDSARIVRARSEPHNWLTYYGAYDGQRYSSLDQINASNVTQLRPA